MIMTREELKLVNLINLRVIIYIQGVPQKTILNFICLKHCICVYCK